MVTVRTECHVPPTPHCHLMSSASEQETDRSLPLFPWWETVLFPPHSAGERVCDVHSSCGLRLVTCLMVSWLVSTAHGQSVWVIDDTEISWGKLSMRPIVTIFFRQKWLFSGFIISLNWEGATPNRPWVTILLLRA